jgi:chaperone protein DnaK
MPPIVGIDLGTTNSLAAYVRDGEPEVIPGPNGDKIVPSVIFIGEANRPVVGSNAKRWMLFDPQHIVFSVKRFMGRSLEDVRAEQAFLPFQLTDEGDGVVRFLIGRRRYTAHELSANVLAELKHRAEVYFGEPVIDAVITVPAYFNDSQRQATKDAGRIAGLNVLRIINEPTAAALAYGLHRHDEGIVAVYDLGGGTFDISILKLKDGIFEVLATGGDTRLGGDDIDQRLMSWMVEELRAEHGFDASNDPESLGALREAAETAKIELSTALETTIQLVFPQAGVHYERWLERHEFDELVGDIVKRTAGPCLRALDDAGLSEGHVDEVVLVGGSTRMPLVQRWVEGIFGRTPQTEINPEEVVALGAAIQAEILGGRSRHMLLLDVTPLSLGIETMGGIMSVLIPRNSTVPTSVAEMFTTYADGQTVVDIHVLQGDRDLAKDCRSLGRFELRIPPQPAGLPRIEVTFHIDANGILQVAAHDLKTGVEQSISVTPSHGLDAGTIERMVQEAASRREEDRKARVLIEVRNDADFIVRATERALVQGEGVIGAERLEEIQRGLAELKAVRNGEDPEHIRAVLNVFNAATTDLASALMDSAVKTALVNRQVSNVLSS